MLRKNATFADWISHSRNSNENLPVHCSDKKYKKINFNFACHFASRRAGIWDVYKNMFDWAEIAKSPRSQRDNTTPDWEKHLPKGSSPLAWVLDHTLNQGKFPTTELSFSLCTPQRSTLSFKWERYVFEHWISIIWVSSIDRLNWRTPKGQLLQLVSWPVALYHNPLGTPDSPKRAH